MTRTITTRAELDALPFPSAVTLHAEDWHKRRDGSWLCDDGDILTAGGLVRYAERRDAAIVLVSPVAPESAVEALDALVELAKMGVVGSVRQMVDAFAKDVRAALTNPEGEPT